LKKIFLTVITLTLSLLLFACSYKSQVSSTSYKLETGEIMTVEVDVTLEQVEEIPFQIKKDGRVIFVGNFITKNWCINYIKLSEQDRNKINEGIIGTNKYHLFQDSITKNYEYLILVNESDIAVSLISNQELNELEKNFQLVKIFQVIK